MSMNADLTTLVDTLHSLVAVMEEESELLSLHGPVEPSMELARAKIRLAARLDEVSARLYRRDADWLAALDPDMRAELAEAYQDMHTASVVNSDILERQIEISTQMLETVGREIERMTGHGSKTYGAGGKIRRGRKKPPLSINTRL